MTPGSHIPRNLEGPIFPPMFVVRCPKSQQMPGDLDQRSYPNLGYIVDNRDINSYVCIIYGYNYTYH